MNPYLLREVLDRRRERLLAIARAIEDEVTLLDPPGAHPLALRGSIEDRLDLASCARLAAALHHNARCKLAEGSQPGFRVSSGRIDAPVLPLPGDEDDNA